MRDIDTVGVSVKESSGLALVLCCLKSVFPVIFSSQISSAREILGVVKLYSITDYQLICLPITLLINRYQSLPDQTRMCTLDQHTFILGQGPTLVASDNTLSVIAHTQAQLGLGVPTLNLVTAKCAPPPAPPPRPRDPAPESVSVLTLPSFPCGLASQAFPKKLCVAWLVSAL